LHPCNAAAVRADRRKNDDVNSLFYNCRADLLISTEGLAGERRDVDAELGDEYGTGRRSREQIVVHETAPVGTNPIEEVLLAVYHATSMQCAFWDSSTANGG